MKVLRRTPGGRRTQTSKGGNRGTLGEVGRQALWEFRRGGVSAGFAERVLRARSSRLAGLIGRWGESSVCVTCWREAFESRPTGSKHGEPQEAPILALVDDEPRRGGGFGFRMTDAANNTTGNIRSHENSHDCSLCTTK